jgi:FkbM family methyltransferase
MGTSSEPSGASTTTSLPWGLLCLVALVSALLGAFAAQPFLQLPPQSPELHSTASATGRSGSPLIVRGERAFCAPLRDYAPDDPSHSILRFLHKGSPSFWVSVPVPDHVGLAASALKGGGLLASGYEVFQAYIEDTPQDAIILDIGGHFGFAGVPMAATGRTVISFEPVPSNQRLHQIAVCLNGFFDRYTLVRGAVGEREGNVTLYVPNSDWTDNSALSQGASTSEVGGKSTATPVRLFALDAFAAEHMAAGEAARVGFVKVDVQGSETSVFRGGRRLFAALAPGTWVMAEHTPSLMRLSGFEPHEDAEALIALGYTVHGEKNGPELLPAQWEEASLDLWYKKG